MFKSVSDGETMKTRTGRPRGLTRLACSLGLDRNPLRRATDRAEAWIRVGLLGVFLIAGPMAAVSAGHWAYHAGTTPARVPAAPTHSVKPAALQQAPTITDLPRAGQGGRVWAGAPGQDTGPSARTGEVLAAVRKMFRRTGSAPCSEENNAWRAVSQAAPSRDFLCLSFCRRHPAAA